MELTNLEIWVIIGVLLLIAEIAAVSFFMMFFGLGALATALLTYLEFTNDLSSQITVFLLVSVGSVFLFRKQLKELFNRKGEKYEELINERANVSLAIPANGQGKVFYRGADWIAETLTETAIEKGASVFIRKVDGIRLFVEAEK